MRWMDRFRRKTKSESTQELASLLVQMAGGSVEALNSVYEVFSEKVEKGIHLPSYGYSALSPPIGRSF